MVLASASVSASSKERREISHSTNRAKDAARSDHSSYPPVLPQLSLPRRHVYWVRLFARL